MIAVSAPPRASPAVTPRSHGGFSERRAAAGPPANRYTASIASAARRSYDGPMSDATAVARFGALARAGSQFCATAAILGVWLVAERLFDAFGPARGAQEAIRR